jgi:hypothetical protein
MEKKKKKKKQQFKKSGFTRDGSAYGTTLSDWF